MFSNGATLPVSRTSWGLGATEVLVSNKALALELGGFMVLLE